VTLDSSGMRGTCGLGVADFNQNRWPTSIRMGGRLAPDSVAGLVQITHGRCSGIELGGVPLPEFNLISVEVTRLVQGLCRANRWGFLTWLET
jgi:hypothetical protein